MEVRVMNMDTGVQVRSRSAARLKRAREWHLYLGTLFAPSLLFFALTGAVQLFGLHETRPGSSYQPPVWIQKLASIHKDQSIGEKHGQPPESGRKQQQQLQGAPTEKGEAPAANEAALSPQRPADARPGSSTHDEKGKSKIPTYLLKWFFLGAALGLVSSTLLGIYMAFKFNRSRGLVWSLLVLGTLIPVILVVLMA